MFGIIIATHGRMAEEIKNVAEMVMGGQECFEAVGLFEGESMEQMSEKIKNAVTEMSADEAVIFVDMRGATPNNGALLALSEMKPCRIVTGVNLPMVLEAVSLRDGKEFGEMDSFISYLIKTGRESIDAMALN